MHLVKKYFLMGFSYSQHGPLGCSIPADRVKPIWMPHYEEQQSNPGFEGLRYRCFVLDLVDVVCDSVKQISFLVIGY